MTKNDPSFFPMNNLRNPFPVPQLCVQVLIFVSARSPAKESPPSTEVTKLVLQMIPRGGHGSSPDLHPKGFIAQTGVM